MGWLRELMSASRPPFKSFGSLARNALQHSDWPADSRPQARSLAALLSKLDRGIELEWLTERPAVQQVLASLLDCPVQDIQEASGSALSTAGHAPARLRLTDLPLARPFDFLDEALPPGIPGRVLEPRRWRRLLWSAGNGSGRSLVGRWLASRGLAEFVQARNLDVLSRLPERGPFFIELDEAPAKLEAPEYLPGLCIATPYSGATDFERVDSPDLMEVSGPLARWVGARLPNDGYFDVERGESFLRAQIASGKVRDLGSALGALGVVDSFDPKRLANSTWLELARAHFELTFSESLERGTSDAVWLKKNGFDLLLSMLTAGLMEGSSGDQAARSFDAWLALVPPDMQRGRDIEWLTLSLERAGSKIQPRDVARAARLVPPGAFRIVRAFEQAGILVRGADDSLALAPRWFALELLTQSLARLVSGSPFEWGEALLATRHAPAVFAELCRRVEAGDGRALEAALEHSDDASPAQVAALEAGFRAAGLALLCGSEVSFDLDALWEEQARLWVELPQELPRQRVESELADPDLSQGAFLAAALAISTELEDPSIARHPLLCPWRERSVHPRLLQVLDQILSAGVRAFAAGKRWAPGVFWLGERLLEALGPLRPESPHALLVPALTLDEALHGLFESRPLNDFMLAGLQEIVRRRRLAFSDVAMLLLSAWHSAGRVESGWLFSDAARRLLWPHADPALLAAELRAKRHAELLPFESFGEEQWQALSKFPDALLEVGSAALPHLPELQLRELLELLQPHAISRAAAALWRHHPGALLEHAAHALSEAESAVFEWFEAAPPALDAQLVALAQTIEAPLNLPDATLAGLRGWLHGLVRRRSPAYREAYALLASLEGRLLAYREL